MKVIALALAAVILLQTLPMVIGMLSNKRDVQLAAAQELEAATEQLLERGYIHET